MNKKEQNTAIAKLTGFEADYFSDLNAMHKAERILDPAQRRIYAVLLRPKNSIDNVDNEWGICHKSAKDRFEAFLITLLII